MVWLLYKPPSWFATVSFHVVTADCFRVFRLGRAISVFFWCYSTVGSSHEEGFGGNGSGGVGAEMSSGSDLALTCLRCPRVSMAIFW